MMRNWFRKAPPAEPLQLQRGFFSTDQIDPRVSRKKLLPLSLAASFQKSIKDFSMVDADGNSFAMDDNNFQTIKTLNGTFGQNVPDAQLGWYAGQGFIGYQTCAMIAQNWLIDKACTMPARDACRNGYDITSSDGTEVPPEVIDRIVMLDRKYGLADHCVQFVRNARIFGIRIAMFKVESNDAQYYQKPFNPDGIGKGKYKGIVQIDPYWITPELDQSAATDPSSPNFYDPTWWRINGMRVHKSHLVIMRNGIVPDILKPSYLYGGIPVPQKLYERVYAAERTANEAPMLAMSKRLTVLNVDISKAMSDIEAFNQKMTLWTSIMNNFGAKIIGEDEKIEQFDTSLNDLDMVIMTQFQLVAAAAEVPATKLLGTTPKGFNATGEYEEASYHEYLESIQEHDISPLIDRHHLCLIRSEIVGTMGITKPFNTETAWRPVDSPTAVEQADLNLKKAQTDTALTTCGAINGEDIRARLMSDRDSGYTGMTTTMEEDPNDPDPDDEEGE